MSRYDFVIADRSLMDTIAYGIVLGKLSFALARAYIPYICTYYKDILVLDPYAFDYQKPDGIRDMDVDFRLGVHHTLTELYDKHGVSFKLINSQKELDGYQV